MRGRMSGSGLGCSECAERKRYEARFFAEDTCVGFLGFSAPLKCWKRDISSLREETELV